MRYFPAIPAYTIECSIITYIICYFTHPTVICELCRDKGQMTTLTDNEFRRNDSGEHQRFFCLLYLWVFFFFLGNHKMCLEILPLYNKNAMSFQLGSNTKLNI